jgi:putative ABC transport system permease protein
MDQLIQDIRFAIRTLTKSPMITTLCVLCLSVGIGLNANIYGAVYMAFQRPLPFSDPDHVVSVELRQAKRGFNSNAMGWQQYKDLREKSASLSEMAGISFRSISLTDGEEPVRLQGELVTWNLFPMLGVAPVVGRQFRQDDDKLGAPDVIMLGHGIWERRFGADSGVVGKVISVNGVPHTVVGVMPRGFMFPEQQEAWVPMAPRVEGRPGDIWDVQVFGRLKPGVAVASATQELTTLSDKLAEVRPKDLGDWRAAATPLRDAFIDPDTRLVIAAMMGAVTFVLLIACANVANLLLARATTRSREIAVRIALGAGRGRIVRQLLTESTLLALMATPIGIGISFWLMDLILASIPDGDMPYYFVFEINGQVLAYTVVVAIITGIVFGLAPALQSVRGDLHSSLKEGGRGSASGGTRQKLRSVFATAQVALSMVLLVGAALFVRSFLNLQTRSFGINSANLLTMRVYFPGLRYDSATALAMRVEDIVQRVEGLPGVVAATASNQIPLSGGGSGGPVEIEGKPQANRADAPGVRWTGVTEHWFTALGIQMVSGRGLTDVEARTKAPVAVINQSMARRFWPDADAVGRRFKMLSGDTATNSWITVIGVSKDYKTQNLDDTDPIGANFITGYRYLATRNTGFMIRVNGDPTQYTTAVRKAIRDADPTLPVFQVASMEKVRADGIWSQRLFGWLFALFGIVALVLASVGVYGVIAYGVSQRTQEIGVRVALGAQPLDVIKLVVRGGAALAFTGVGVGLVGAFAVTRLIQSLLVDVSATDPVSFIGVTLFLTTVALVASYVPARRATKVDPLTALRAE